MPDEPKEFSKAAEELIGDLRGIPFNEPRNMRRRPTKPMAPLIEELLVKYQIGRHSNEQTIRDHWPEIVGTANAAYSHPVRIERSRSLFVLVSHSVVRSELFLHRAAILEKIRNLPGCDQVRELFLARGEARPRVRAGSGFGVGQLSDPERRTLHPEPLLTARRAKIRLHAPAASRILATCVSDSPSVAGCHHD